MREFLIVVLGLCLFFSIVRIVRYRNDINKQCQEMVDNVKARKFPDAELYFTSKIQECLPTYKKMLEDIHKQRRETK